MASLVKIALQSCEGTRGLAIRLVGSDTEIEWIEGMETADAVRREKKEGSYEHQNASGYHSLRVNQRLPLGWPRPNETDSFDAVQTAQEGPQ